MKIAISGAGIAGPTLAYWLMRAGHEPILIERSPHLRTRGYIIDLSGPGYALAEQMGILPALEEASHPIDSVRFVDAEGEQVGGFGIDLFRRTLGDPFISVPRGDLAAAIYQSLGGDIEALFATSIVDFEEHADGVRIQLSTGAEREVDLLVGADGLHSAVRAIAFGNEAKVRRPLGYYVAAFGALGYPHREEGVCVSHTMPGRQITRFSERNDRTLFQFIFADKWLGDVPTGTPDGRIQAVLSAFEDSGWEWPEIRAWVGVADDVYLDRIIQIHMNRWSKGRVALIGDAAGGVSLFAGEGASLGMEAGYALAYALAEANGDYRTAFVRYEASLRTKVEERQREARRIARVFTPRTAPGLWLRNRATGLLGAPLLPPTLEGFDPAPGFSLPAWPPQKQEIEA